MELGTRRRRRSSEQGPASGADYLSALPDDLLLLVLARLGCAAAAARTSLLSRRWRGMWASLRDLVFRGVAFPSLEAAVGRVTRPPPAVSLLEIRVSDDHRPTSGAVTSLLRAAALLAPEKLVFALPVRQQRHPTDFHLPCFHHATSIALKWIPFVLRPPAAGGEFPALQTLSLTGCQVDGLGALLSLCPHLRVLRLKRPIWLGGDDDGTTVHSASLQELVMEATMFESRVDIVAPMLKQLTVSLRALEQVSITILTPMVEKVSWQWLYHNGTVLFGLWTLEKLRLQTAQRPGQLPLLLIHAFTSWYSFPDAATNFAQEIEKHMVVDFSALELHLTLTTTGHIFGAFVSHLLGFYRIRNVIRRLKVALLRLVGKDVCPSVCPCQPTNWRTQIISLTALEEVEIDGFEGEDHELDFLKLVLSCAPMLKKVIVKLSDEDSSSDDRCTRIDDIFRGYSSVKCNVYLSSGLMHQSQNCLQT